MSSYIEQHPLVECPAWFRYAPPGRTAYGAQSEPTPTIYFDTAQYGVETKDAVGLLAMTRKNCNIRLM